MNKKLEGMTIEGILAEMTDSAEGAIKVPIAKGVNIKSLIKGDDDPMFVVVEALNEGVSGSNRKYSPETIEDIAKQINKNKPDAYIGHLKDEDRPYANPESQTLWIGAKTLKVGGSKRLFIKGYILPYAEVLKKYIRAAQAVGKSIAVSIYGTANEILNASGVKEVLDFSLETIDWARPAAAGVKTLGYMSVTREMEDNAKDGDYLKVIENFNAIREMTADTVKAEIIRDQNSQLAVVAEMLNTEPKEVKTIVAEMRSTIMEQEKELTDRFIDEELSNRLPTKSVRNVAKVLVLAEMKKESYNRARASEVINTTLASKAVGKVISEMSGKIDINPPTGSGSDSRKFTKVEKKS